LYVQIWLKTPSVIPADAAIQLAARFETWIPTVADMMNLEQSSNPLLNKVNQAVAPILNSLRALPYSMASRSLSVQFID
jgi:hypothetical protein